MQMPNRAASWWMELEDILWPQQKIRDKIQQRAQSMADAHVNLVITFGFHARFDFSDHFASLHGYLNDVCDALHAHGIEYMDHYSCNMIQRPRGEKHFKHLHASHRHHVLLHPDEKAAEHAQYEGVRFRDIVEIDIRTGQPAYSDVYFSEHFCHNNPDFLRMHRLYLERLVKEVPIDYLMADDMCDYMGPASCVCAHCRARFKKDYGRDIPPFEDKSFWGDTTLPKLQWGNYENPAWRDYMQMKVDGIVDHVRMIKETIGDIPYTTCCSSSGTWHLNGIGLDLEQLSDVIDITMFENCGLDVSTLNWPRAEFEVLLRKALLQEKGLPILALGYSTFSDGAYLSWAVARFWGTANWFSTLHGRLPKYIEGLPENETLIAPYYRWEVSNSPLNPFAGEDVPDARLLFNYYNRRRATQSAQGKEYFADIQAFTMCAVWENINLELIRYTTFADKSALCASNTPMIIDSCACVSDAQFEALKTFLQQGGKVLLRLPFGIYDENGEKREIPLSESLLAKQYAGLRLMGDESVREALQNLKKDGVITPRVQLIQGEGWATRLRIHDGKPKLHLLRTALEGIPHESIISWGGKPVMESMKAVHPENTIEVEVDMQDLQHFEGFSLSPETGAQKRKVIVTDLCNNRVRLTVDVSGITLYAMVE